MFGFLKKDPFGDELTFGYMYENSGTHGFPAHGVRRTHRIRWSYEKLPASGEKQSHHRQAHRDVKSTPHLALG